MGLEAMDLWENSWLAGALLWGSQRTCLDSLGIKFQAVLLVSEELLNILALISLKLNHLPHLSVDDDGAIAGYGRVLAVLNNVATSTDTGTYQTSSWWPWGFSSGQTSWEDLEQWSKSYDHCVLCFDQYSYHFNMVSDTMGITPEDVLWGKIKRGHCTDVGYECGCNSGIALSLPYPRRLRRRDLCYWQVSYIYWDKMTEQAPQEQVRERYCLQIGRSPHCYSGEEMRSRTKGF